MTKVFFAGQSAQISGISGIETNRNQPSAFNLLLLIFHRIPVQQSIWKQGTKAYASFTSLRQLERHEPEVYRLFAAGGRIADGQHVETAIYGYRLRDGGGKFGFSVTRFDKTKEGEDQQQPQHQQQPTQLPTCITNTNTNTTTAAAVVDSGAEVRKVLLPADSMTKSKSTTTAAAATISSEIRSVNKQALLQRLYNIEHSINELTVFVEGSRW